MTAKAPSDLDPKTFARKYGPWAVIAGGSDGTGEEYARQLAGVGINVMLVARRAEVLDALATDLRARYGIETRTFVQDLMVPDAAQNILQASAGLDVGIYISNAGIDGTGASFLDQPVERWRRMTNMNVLTVMETLHGFGTRLRTRGSGGIIVMTTMGALGGTPYLGMYAATKAFDLILAESLWGELLDTDVDVIAVLATAMTTPFFMKNIAGQDFKLGDHVYDPAHVVSTALGALGRSPTVMFGTSQMPDVVCLTRQRHDDLLRSLDAGRSFFPKSEKIL